jgi:hypothetical protein
MRSCGELPSAQELFDELRANQFKGDPEARCMPQRRPQAVTLPYPFGMINALPKHFMRASWMGYRVGKWTAIISS